MSLSNSTAGPLLIADLVGLDQDPRPGAQYRALTGLATSQLTSLESRITNALPSIADGFEYERLAVLRARTRRVVSQRTATDPYAELLALAV